MSSIESSKEIENYLDHQREKILPELDRLKTYLQTMKEFVEFSASDEGQKQIELSLLQQSQLVAWLFNIAEQTTRPDGWESLSKAENIIREQVPQGLVNIEKRYGYKSLKAVLLATEFFDIREEPTDRSGTRVLYRIKPDLKFED
jgi:hypothetical protein